MCLNTGTPKNINFPLGTNGKLMVLDRVSQYLSTLGHFFNCFGRKKIPYDRINTILTYIFGSLCGVETSHLVIKKLVFTTLPSFKNVKLNLVS